MTTKPTQQQPDSYKWLILALSAFTFTFVVAIPQMSLPVLFAEISADLDLSLVQVGWVWGIGSVMGILVGIIGGTIGDRFGPRRTLAVACVLMGIAGAARGLSTGFAGLAVTSLITGLAHWSIPMNVHKTCGIWFPREKLGMANGIVSMGMALGFMSGSLLAATVLSPLLGGWRHLLFAYGAVGVLFGIFWWRTQEKEAGEDPLSEQRAGFSESIGHVMRSRNVWLFCIATACASGCVNGMLGFLPLYLRNLGWEPVAADSTLASFHAISMVCAIPAALLSDRLGSRRGILMAAAVFIGAGTGLLGFAGGMLIPAAVLMAGVFRDGFMAITMTAIIEVKNIGARFAGTAIGLSLSVMGVVNVLSPPVGNWMERFGPGVPFLFWASLVVVSLVCYLLIPTGKVEASGTGQSD